MDETLGETLNSLAGKPIEVKPTLFDASSTEAMAEVASLLKSGAIRRVSDDYREQCRELFGVRNPSDVYKPGFEASFEEYYKSLGDIATLGFWAFFPWNSTLVHILPEPEYRLVRTARNRNLVTEAEQERFYNARIGIAGLSVGSSVAFAIALSGGGKHLKLADMDTLALSNTNRVLASSTELGQRKVDMAARRIYEINPYADIETYPEGLTKDTVGPFCDGLDVLIDEMDNIAMKYAFRVEAKKRKLPIVMAADNGDNAVVDVERYDLDPDLPFFHGRLGEVTYDELASLDKFGIGRTITKHVGPENVTVRMQESLLEMGGKRSFPGRSLASLALVNGAAVAYCVRRILNGQTIESDRALVSLDEKLIPEYSTPEEVERRTKAAETFRKMFDCRTMDPAILRRIVEAGNSAPSGENCQPWRFKLSEGNVIDVYLYRSDRSVYNWGDRASYMAIGAATENIVLAATDLGYDTGVSYFPSGTSEHVVRITFTPAASPKKTELGRFIFDRVTNRKPYEKRPLQKEVRDALAAHATPAVRISFVEDPKLMRRLGRDGSTNEEVMLTNAHIHDFFFSHVSWTKEEDDEKRAGFYIETLELPGPGKLIFKLLRSPRRARLLNRIGLYNLVAAGNGTTNATASAIGGLSITSTEPEVFVAAGRALEQLWLQATGLGLSFQPIAGMLFMKLCIDMGERTQFTPTNLKAIDRAYADASSLLSTKGERLMFMFRVGYGNPPTARSSRFPLETVLS